MNFSEINSIIKLLNQEKLVILNTDTIPALIGDSSSAVAIKKIYQAKKRTKNKPIALLVSDTKLIKNYAILNEESEKIFQQSTKTISIILPQKQKNNLAPNINQNDNSISIRIPKDKFLIELISKFGRALAATSVNISDKELLTDTNLIKKEFADSVDYIEPITNLNTASTIIKQGSTNFQIVRSGSVSLSEIKKITK
jgi:L-threonylcarbamoyladenylate synthase